MAAPPTILLATRNAHKVAEIRQILGEEFTYLTLNDFWGAPIVPENAPTFETNALKKAFTLAFWLAENPQLLRVKLPEGDPPFYVLADDSGLEVDALNGAPGVYSARFAGLDVGAIGNSPDSANNAKLLRLLDGVPAKKRSARFRCVLALTRVHHSTGEGETAVPAVEKQTATFEGVCEGKISSTPGGRGGFGYDPLFIPTGHKQSFAELGEDVKNKLSHRARALEKLKARFVSNAG
jgi:XTP/dITP diphosphohydrolase